MSYFRECPNCGDNLDPGEVCRCQDIKRAAPELEPPKAAKTMNPASFYAEDTEKSRGEGALCPGFTPMTRCETPSGTMLSETDSLNGSPSAPSVESRSKTDTAITSMAEDSANSALMTTSERTSPDETQNQALIALIQEPIIEEHLHSIKARVEATVANAMALVCTEETIQSVKAARSALNKEFEELEVQRKAIKAAVLEKYNAFEALYKECATTPYKRGDLDLKQKISDVESEMKDRCESALREYFEELCEAHHIDFVPFERLGITISMADAKAKTQPPKKLREQVTQFVTGISQSMETISEMENADEIMQEFKRILDATSAIGTVLERHRRIEAEKAAREARAAAKAQEAEAVKKVEAFAPPTVVQAPVEAPSFTPPAPVQPPQDERICKCTFTVRATKAQLKRLKEFMNMEGIRYE